MRNLLTNPLTVFWLCCFPLASNAFESTLMPEGDTLNLMDEKIPDTDLNQYRGGYVDSSGVMIRFGLEKTVLIDGMVEFKSLFQLSLDEAGLAVQTPVRNALVQMGQHNQYTSQTTSQIINNALTTVIQNNMDNKIIQNIQQFNIEISNIGQLNNRGVQSLLLPQLIQSLN